jgi:saccharopine dehydrogenase-like NADP-dependent oxidoreductase
MANPEVSQVIVCDVSEAQLQACIAKLAGKSGAEKLGVVRLDLNSLQSTAELMASFDAIVAALPASISHLAMQAALQVGTPLVDMAIPNAAGLATLSDAVKGARSCVVLGCGLEPGLTEILARHLAEKKEMGLLSTKAIQADGLSVVPKRMLDALLYPRVRLDKHEPDIAVLRVEVLGHKAGQCCRLQAEMVDHYDKSLGFTAMARTTAFTASIVAQMIARGELHATRLSHPEQVIRGPGFDRLLIELAKYDIKFNFSETLTE